MQYSSTITLEHNKRGVWILDPFKGCDLGTDGGCWGICYAASIARRRGFDFSKVVARDFKSRAHRMSICRTLYGLDFVRMGGHCDPSSDWHHTIEIIKKIRPYSKNIVLITKHINTIKDNYLCYLSGIVVNTSISAIDDTETINNRLEQFHRLKSYCKSVLRVNTLKFNTNNAGGEKYNNVQNALLKNTPTIDNVLRIGKNHELVRRSVIVVEKEKFMGGTQWVSRNDKTTYFGKCENCPDKCGVNL